MSTLAYTAANTERVELMTGIIPLYRSPALIAQTAATLDALSGRFVLGLGTSGPQVIEGWHGVPFEKDGRTRDTTTSAARSGARQGHPRWQRTAALRRRHRTRQAPAHEPAARPRHPDLDRIDRPENVELTAEVADIWQTIHFVPDRFEQVWGEALKTGLASAIRKRSRLRLSPDSSWRSARATTSRSPRRSSRPDRLLRGRHGPNKELHNDLFKRYGWEEEAEEIQDLFLSGKNGGVQRYARSTSTCRR